MKQTNKLNLPNLGYGLGLRNQHLNDILNDDPKVDWFEVISENYMDNHGYSRYALEKVREKTPVVMHGVSMSIGSTDPLNKEYLNKLNALATWLEPAWVSDHLCWTGIHGTNTHDLLPMPLTEESLNHVGCRVNQVQEILQRPLILENPSTYLEFSSSSLSEWEYLSELVRLTGCGLLLDVNNVYVSAHNHSFNPEEYINHLPHDHIVQIHLAGPTNVNGLLIDTHDKPVPTKVWQLYKQAMELTSGVSTMLEWDADIPPFLQLVEELHKAKAVLKGELPDININQTEGMPISNPVDFQLNKVVYKDYEATV